SKLSHAKSGAPNKSTKPSSVGVTILLCTHNGAAFLEQQLESISAQTHADWRLVVSDDASSDATLDIMKRWSSHRVEDQVEIRGRAEAQGAIANFMSLLTDGGIGSDYFACSDQDDVWQPEKLERALRQLTLVSADLPAVYFSRTRNVDSFGHPI